MERLSRGSRRSLVVSDTLRKTASWLEPVYKGIGVGIVASPEFRHILVKSVASLSWQKANLQESCVPQPLKPNFETSAIIDNESYRTSWNPSPKLRPEPQIT